MHGVDEVLMRDCKLLIRPCRNDTVNGEFFDRDCRCVCFKEVHGGNGGSVDVLKLCIFSDSVEVGGDSCQCGCGCFHNGVSVIDYEDDNYYRQTIVDVCSIGYAFILVQYRYAIFVFTRNYGEGAFLWVCFCAQTYHKFLKWEQFVKHFKDNMALYFFVSIIVFIEHLILVRLNLCIFILTNSAESNINADRYISVIEMLFFEDRN